MVTRILECDLLPNLSTSLFTWWRQIFLSRTSLEKSRCILTPVPLRFGKTSDNGTIHRLNRVCELYSQQFYHVLKGSHRNLLLSLHSPVLLVLSLWIWYCFAETYIKNIVVIVSILADINVVIFLKVSELIHSCNSHHVRVCPVSATNWVSMRQPEALLLSIPFPTGWSHCQSDTWNCS